MLFVIGEALDTHLKDTDALLFDMRFNGGGSANEALSLVQLFKTDVHLVKDRVLANVYSQDYMRSRNVTSKPNDRYSSLFDLVTDDFDFGVHYVKPVGVFTSGTCSFFWGEG
jgi:hypothetical protein